VHIFGVLFSFQAKFSLFAAHLFVRRLLLGRSTQLKHTGTMPLTVVVTGANTGLGLELCTQLHARGDAVYATCRASSKELDALGVAKVITGIDVTSTDAADKLVAALKDVSIDCLINNGRGGGSLQAGGGWRVALNTSLQHRYYAFLFTCRLHL
jgi:NADPH:quinone reductase-like Zn-dependent oxidoreductase